MDIDWSEIAGLSTAVLSAAAATGSWRAARRANATARDALATADAVARIEHERWRAERQPEVIVTHTQEPSGHFLDVHLYGPDRLISLDEVSISIVNDDQDHELNVATRDVTQEQLDAFVWGPYRFAPHSNGGDEHGRTVRCLDLPVGKGRRFALERTRPGPWMTATTQEAWERQYQGHPLRTRFTCRRGDEAWVLARDAAWDPWPRGHREGGAFV